MWTLSSLVYGFCALLLRPFAAGSPWVPLVVLGVLTGVLLLVVFRFTSNQSGITRTKDAIKAYILEMWLFRNDPRIMLSAQGRILGLNGRYLGLMIKPMVVLILPVGLLLVALEGWFGTRPLQPGEAALVTVQVAESTPDLLQRITLTAGDGLAVETPSLRIPSRREITWRIRADSAGQHALLVQVDTHRVAKNVVVSDHLLPAVPQRMGAGSWEGFLSPAEPLIPREVGLTKVHVQYPGRALTLFGWHIHWLISFFVISFASGFALKGLVGVDF